MISFHIYTLAPYWLEGMFSTGVRLHQESLKCRWFTPYTGLFSSRDHKQRGQGDIKTSWVIQCIKWNITVNTLVINHDGSSQNKTLLQRQKLVYFVTLSPSGLSTACFVCERMFRLSNGRFPLTLYIDNRRRKSKIFLIGRWNKIK